MRHRLLRCFLVCVVCIIVWPSSARHISAQIRIRIPRPRTEPVKNPPPADTGNPSARKTDNTGTATKPPPNEPSGPAIPTSIILDDGFTFFVLQGKKDYVDGKPIDKGWSLVSNLRMAGPSIPKHSMFKIVVTKAGQAVATIRCEAVIAAVPAHEVGRVVVPMIGYCYDNTQLVKGEGKFGVAVYFVNGDDDSERLARNYEIEVHKVDRVRGPNTNPQPDVPNYYISRHAEVLSSIIYLRPQRSLPYVNNADAEGAGVNRVEITYNASTTEEGAAMGWGGGFVRCSVDGQRIDLKDDKVVHHRASNREYQEFHTDRLLPEFRRGNEYKDEINFRQHIATLPFTWGKVVVYHNYTKLEDHPGRWECAYREGANVVRTWRWTVRQDGSVAPHPEESSELTFFPGAHLVDTEIPTGGSFIDKRIVPEAVRAGFIYGHRWQTPEGKAMAAKVPAKGKPWPVPSTAR